MRISSISSKGQLTIPKDIQLALHVKPYSKVVLYTERDTLMIKPLKHSIVDQTAGSLTQYIQPSKRGQPFSTILKQAKKKTAQKLVKRL